jgi:hypothetical protein
MTDYYVNTDKPREVKPEDIVAIAPVPNSGDKWEDFPEETKKVYKVIIHDFLEWNPPANNMFQSDSGVCCIIYDDKSVGVHFKVNDTVFNIRILEENYNGK